jgi:hypothetical protein
MVTKVELAELVLPEFGLPTVQPTIPVETYNARISSAHSKASEAGHDALIVYGDREHFANIAYLTGYDPRFEEALLILIPNNKPVLLVGNEGMGYAEMMELDVNLVLYQTFSLLGQPRGKSPALENILRDAGIKQGQQIGVIGWKAFDSREFNDPDHTLEIPSFIVDVLAELVGDRQNLLNATYLFMNPVDGLRTINDVDQIAYFEFASSYTSQGLRNVLLGVQANMTEFEAVTLMKLTGIPLACHLMLSSGDRASLGLPSPSLRKMKLGDKTTMAYGAWGSLNARAGWLAHDANDLPEDVQDYVEKLVKPYFHAIVEWYETVGIGVTGGELYSIIQKHLGDPFFGIGLNPGHLIHLDEWLHSPIYEDSTMKLRSGMAIQVDVIPATHSPYHTTNIEDGIALADGELCAELSLKYPEAWERIEHRRAYMENTLGIKLKPEVLPFSNIPAYLPPFWLSPQMAMRVAE